MAPVFFVMAAGLKLRVAAVVYDYKKAVVRISARIYSVLKTGYHEIYQLTIDREVSPYAGLHNRGEESESALSLCNN